MPTITEHFLDLVKDEMYENIGSPKYVEADFLPFIQEGGWEFNFFVFPLSNSILNGLDIDEEVDRFISNLNSLIPEMIKHGGLAQMAEIPEDSVGSRLPCHGYII